MRILYSNHVEDATITSSTENPYYPFLTAFNDTDLTTYGRTVDDDDQWIKFSFSGAVAVDYVCAFGHNITNAATIKIQANATDVWTAPSVDQTLAWADFICYKFTAQQSYRYWRLTIDDAANPDEYIQISKVFLGTYLQMPGISPDCVLPRKSNAEVVKSPTGQIYGDRRIIYRAAEVAFPGITETQRTAINLFFADVDLVKPFILLVWEDDLTVEPPLWCALTESLSWGKIKTTGGVLWSLSLKFEECK